MAHPKGLLIERAQKLGLERPDFDTAKTGPEHEPVFITDVVLDGKVMAPARADRSASRKAAAEEALGANSAESGMAKAVARAAAGSAPRRKAAQAPPRRATHAAPPPGSDDEDDEAFTGPWPMFDDLSHATVSR